MKKYTLFIIGLIILIYPLTFYANFWESYELPKVGLLTLGIFVSLFLYMLRIIGHKESFVNWCPTLSLHLGLVVSIILSSLINRAFPGAFLGQSYRYQGVATQIVYLGLVFIVAQFKKPSPERQLGWFAFMGGTIASCTLLIDFFRYSPLWSLGGFRLAGFFGNPNFAAGYLAFCLAYALYLFDNKSWWLNLGITSLFSLAILLTGSRSGLLAAVVVILFSWSKKRLELILIPLIIGLLLLFMVRAPSAFDTRGQIWSRGLWAWSQKPLFGWGIESFEPAFESTLTDQDFDLNNIRVDKAHNEILEYLVTGGLVSVAIWLLLFGKTFQLASRFPPKEKRLHLAVLGAFFILSFVNVLSVSEYVFYYLTIGLVSRKRP